MGRLCIDHGSTMGRPWVDYASTMGRPWVDYASTRGRPWVDIGSTMRRPDLVYRVRSHLGPVMRCPTSNTIGPEEPGSVCAFEQTSVCSTTNLRRLSGRTSSAAEAAQRWDCRLVASSPSENDSFEPICFLGSRNDLTPTTNEMRRSVCTPSRA